jgi:type IV pilus assembly protein PilO
MKKLANMFAAKPSLSLPKVDFQGFVDDFRSLDPKNPGAWPMAPRVVALVGIFLFAVAMAALLGWQSQYDELDAKRQEELRLREDWTNKKRQAVNLDAYRNQLVEIERAFGALLKQLPNAAEMESLLVDVNQAGLGRGLQFELFKPNTEVVHDFYAELPITINMTGSYHDFGAFAGDVAKLPRIVTLNDIHLTRGKQGDSLSLVTVAKTFRYLDDNEMAERKRQGKPGGAQK